MWRGLRVRTRMLDCGRDVDSRRTSLPQYWGGGGGSNSELELELDKRGAEGSGLGLSVWAISPLPTY